MNLGKFAVQAIKEWNPLGPEAIVRRANNKAFRKAYRKARKGKELTPEEQAIMAENTVTVTLPSGEVIQRTEPTIPARTSTKVAATGVLFGIPVIQFIQDIEFPWPVVEQFTNSDLFVQLATLVLAFITARLVKSPIAPKAI